MSVLPIDLQVTFTKANEHAENIAKQQNLIQTGQSNNIEKIHTQSIEVNNKVNNLEEYSDEFNKINNEEKENQSNKGNFLNKKKQNQNNELNENQNIVSNLKEEGVGKIIDIVE